MKTTKILLSLLILIVSVSAINAAAGLNVILANQNPDPVSPGNFVYLNVQMSNVGDQAIKIDQIKFNENSNFKIAQGESLTQEVGLLSSFSSSSEDSLVVTKYKILVSDKAPLGLNTVNFDIITPNGVFNYEFQVLVQDNNPIVHVENIEVEQASPGDTTQLKVTLSNVNSINLKNVKTAIDFSNANIDTSAITIAKGSNEKIISTLNANEQSTLTFDIAINPGTTSQTYLIPIKITYEDTLENAYENTVYGSVKVYSKPQLSLNLDSQDIYTIGKGKFTLAIANPGNSQIKGVQIQILDSPDYQIIEGENQYVGDLNPDDFQTLQGTIYIKNANEATLKVKVDYADSYDVANEEIIDIPLKIYNQEQLQTLGFAQAGKSSTMLYIIILVITLGGIYFWRKRRKNNHKKHQE